MLSAPINRTRVLGERLAALAFGLVVLAVVECVALLSFSAALGMGSSPTPIIGRSLALAVFGPVRRFGRARHRRRDRACDACAGHRGAGRRRRVSHQRAGADHHRAAAGTPGVPFYLLLGDNPLANGLRRGPAAAVAAVSIALVLLAAVGLERTDPA